MRRGNQTAVTQREVRHTGLRAGDQAAFFALVDRYHATMIQMAEHYVSSRAVAEEVAQEAWIGALRGVANFQGRSTLKAWLFRILINCAKFRAAREARSVPFSALPDTVCLESDRDTDQSFAESKPHWPWRWVEPQDPRARAVVDSFETREQIRRAIGGLPPGQREVIRLRDLEEWTSEEVCQALGVTLVNQRVLLHRARASVRTAITRCSRAPNGEQVELEKLRQPNTSVVKDAA